jgi:hypothetical protein
MGWEGFAQIVYVLLAIRLQQLAEQAGKGPQPDYFGSSNGRQQQQ